MTYYLVGPYPPPLGGVSVYIQRYARILADRGVSVKVIDLRRVSVVRAALWLLSIVANPRRATYHLNEFAFLVMAALILRPFPAHVVFHDHSYRLLGRLDPIRRAVLSRFLSRVNECILIGAHLRDEYAKHGFICPQNTRVEPSFVPPPLEDAARILAAYEEETLTFLHSHRPIVIGNAYQLTLESGVDLYGADMCIGLVAALKEAYPDIGLIFAIPTIGDQSYFAHLTRQIDDLGISQHVHFLTGQKEIWPLFRHADLMVRPTASDGYGISVAEALHLGCAAVASNVCVRPSGTVVFRNRDFADFLEKCKEALSA